MRIRRRAMQLAALIGLAGTMLPARQPWAEPIAEPIAKPIAEPIAEPIAKPVWEGGSYYVLVHYQDAASVRPRVWHWEDRIWEFRREGSDLIWTEFEIVSFMNVTGRFAGLRSETARRLEGAWEPNKAQQREIERGLFANPRGVSSRRLETSEGGFATRRDARRERLGLGIRHAAELRHDPARGEDLLRTTRSLQSVESVDRLEETLYVLGAEADGTRYGSYRSGTRSGRVRLVPTRLRESLRPEVRREGERLVLSPDSRGQWQSFFPALLRPFHYWRSRRVRVDSVPPGALIDVSYLRDGARRLFEETRAPVVLELPPRFMSRREDVVQLDAFSPGFRSTRRTFRVHGKKPAVVIALDAAHDRLEEIWLRPTRGLSTLILFSRHPIELRLGLASTTPTLVLPDVSLTERAGLALEGWPDSGIVPIQLTADLLLRVPENVDPGAVRFHPSPRPGGGHATIVRIPTSAPTDPAPAPPPRRADACDLAFDDALYETLDRDALNRVLAFPDDAVRERLKRTLRALGGAEGETLELHDGSFVAPDRPLEVEAALLRASAVPGLLSQLRRGVRGAPDPAETLRGVIAPAASSAEFRTWLERAERAEEACRRKAAQGSVSRNSRATRAGLRPPESTAPFSRCIADASIRPSSRDKASTISGRSRATRGATMTIAS